MKLIKKIGKALLIVFFSFLALGSLFVEKNLVAAIIFVLALILLTPLGEKIKNTFPEKLQSNAFIALTIVILFFVGGIIMASGSKNTDDESSGEVALESSILEENSNQDVADASSNGEVDRSMPIPDDEEDTPEPTKTPEVKETEAPSPSPEETPTPKETATPTPTPEATPTPTPTPTPTTTPTATPTPTPEVTPAPTPTPQPTVEPVEAKKYSFVLNTSKMTCHNPNCRAVKTIADENRQDFYGSFDEVKSMGYHSCGICNPW